MIEDRGYIDERTTPVLYWDYYYPSSLEWKRINPGEIWAVVYWSNGVFSFFCHTPQGDRDRVLRYKEVPGIEVQSGGANCDTVKYSWPGDIIHDDMT